MRKILSLLMATFFSVGMFAVTYTVAGSKAILGSEWKTDDTNNDMELVAGVYTLVKEGVTLGANTYEYKVAQDHAWDNAWPAQNAKLAIAEDGTYDVTFTFVESTKAVNAVAEKKGSAAVEKHYLVVGQKEIANGKNWDNDADVNLMATADNGVTYTLTIEDLELTKGSAYEYKIVEKGSWTEYFPNQGGANASFSVEETAKYTIKYVFTVATSKCEVQTTKSGDVEPGGDDPQPASKYYMKNNWNGGEDWTWKEMAAAENNTFKLEKVVFGGTGVNYNTAENDEGAQWVEVAAFDGDAVAALDTVTFVLDPAAEKKVKATLLGKYATSEEPGGDPQPSTTYLLFGSDPAIGAWEGAGAVALVDGKVTVTLQAGNCEFKVVSSNWNWDDSFDYSKVNAECSSAGISEGDNGNIKVTLAAAGDMTVEIKDGKLCVTGNFVAGDEPGGDPQPSTTYLLFGSDPAIGAWEGAGAVAMVDGKATVTLQAGDCEFKVVSSNWNWDDSFDYSKVNAECSSAGISEGDNGNIKVTLAAAGDMTVEIKDGKLCVTGNFVAGDEPGGNPQVDGYFLIGSDPAIGGQDWVGANAVSMTDGKATVMLQAGECQFKVVPVINGAWNWEKALGYADVDAECSSAGIESGDNGNVKVVLDVAGEVKVEVKNGKLCVTGEFTIPTTLNLANGFYLIGKTGWTVDALSADLLFKANADKAGEYTLEIALVENDPLKVVKVEGDAITAWYPEGEGNEYKVDAAHAGLKTIYFQETMNPDWAAFGGYIYIEGTTGIESVENAASAQKFIEDGQLFILINGTVYSVMGMVR